MLKTMSQEVVVPPHRQLRADAARNRDKIIGAARCLLAERGPEVPMEAIASAAGVAVGTLYRHFPAKEDLVRAIMRETFEDRLTSLETTLDRIGNGAPFAEELRCLAEKTAETLTANRAAKSAAHALEAGQDAVLRERFARILDQIVVSGRDAGVLRADATGGDLLLLAATVPIDLDPAAQARWLTLFIDGLTSRQQRA